MKKFISVFSIAAVAGGLLAGCANDDFVAAGDGKLLLSANINSDVVIASRADAPIDEADLESSLEVWISNASGRLYRFVGKENIPASLNLLSGSYTAEAWAGDSIPASWDKAWYKALAKFDIAPGQPTRVVLNCKIANTLVAVNFDQTVADVLRDYKMTVSHSRAALEFDADETRTGYFMLPSADNDLLWHLEGTRTADGAPFSLDGKIENVRHFAADGSHQAYQYNLNVSCPETSEDFGGAIFDIEVDITETIIEKEIDIVLPPQIEGYGFDINRPVTGEQGNIPRRSVIVKSGIELGSVVIASDDFINLLGGDAVDLLGIPQVVVDELADAGINFEYSVGDDGTSMMKINFETKFANTLDNGDHIVKITAADNSARAKTTVANLAYNISDAAVIPDEVAFNDISCYSATLSGLVSKDGIENLYFRYRPLNTADWTDVEPVPAALILSRASGFTKDQIVSVSLTGLKAGTTYEWQIVADDWNTDSRTFTTRPDPQLPNNSFEFSHKAAANGSNNKCTYFFEEGGSMWWDSGNHGSATLSTDVTTIISDPVHDGANAVQLHSQKLLIKFAAGNIFAGKYLKTDGTDGVLGWGRPFNGRPKQLKLWARYNPVNITDVASNAPDEYKKGDPDRGIIYVALLDDHLEDYNGQQFPVIIKTKSTELSLFNAYGSNKPHVIAYGEHIFDSSSPATGSSGLVEITIDLDYDSFGRDITPSYILLTASASKGGDYFSGGSGSKLVLDDLQLIYE